MWSRALSAAEIQATYLTGVPAPTTEDELDFYWKFDDKGATEATDASGHGRTGLIGAMATTENQLQYSTGRASQQPLAPIQLPSTAPIISVGTPTVVLIIDGSNEIVLPSSDPDDDDLDLGDGE